MVKLRADMESRFAAQRQSTTQVKPSTSSRSLSLERISELMLDKILNDESLIEANPNLYNGLLEPEAQPPTPTQAKRQVLNLQKQMNKLNSEAIKVIKKFSSRVVELETQCRPQSRKGNQDDPHSDNPEGEKSAKVQRTTTTATFPTKKQKSSSQQQTENLEEVNTDNVVVEADTQNEDAVSDKDVWDDMTYGEGDIPPELGGFDVSDEEDDDVFEEVLRDLIQTEKQIIDPTIENLDSMFSNLHERFGINIQEADPMDQRVNSIYDSVIYKFKSDRDFNTRLVDQ